MCLQKPRYCWLCSENRPAAVYNFWPHQCHVEHTHTHTREQYNWSTRRVQGREIYIFFFLIIILYDVWSLSAARREEHPLPGYALKVLDGDR